MDHSYPYIASLTREPFLFYEMRSTAKLMVEGNSDDAIIKEIVEQNLFQYPTEKSITRMAKACIKRLHALEDDSLISAIASQPTDVAKQICLYALMKQSRLVWEFMLTVIGEKYRLRDTSFGKIDLNIFFMRLQEQNDTVASWSDTTITKLKQIIARVLVETEYLDNLKACLLYTSLLCADTGSYRKGTGWERYEPGNGTYRSRTSPYLGSYTERRLSEISSPE